jgi:hypothetical protein
VKWANEQLAQVGYVYSGNGWRFIAAGHASPGIWLGFGYALVHCGLIFAMLRKRLFLSQSNIGQFQISVGAGRGFTGMYP